MPYYPRYEATFTLTFSSATRRLTIAYVSSLAPSQVLQGNTFTITASPFNSEDVFMYDASSGKTNLKYTKCSTIVSGSRAAFITAVEALITAADVTTDNIDEATAAHGVDVDGVLLKDSTMKLVGLASAPSDPSTDDSAVIYYDSTLNELRALLRNSTTVSRLLATWASHVYTAYYTSGTSINYNGLATEVALTNLNLTLPAGTYLGLYQFSLEPSGTTFAYLKSGGTADMTDGTRVAATICADSDGTRKIMTKVFVLTPVASTLYQVVFMAGTAISTAAVVNNITANVDNPDSYPVFVAIKLD